jgi:uncharacterized membrane protein (DUF4010 family)
MLKAVLRPSDKSSLHFCPPVSAVHGMDYFDVFRAIGMSLGLGLLVGLQREYAASQIAGIRTFALVTLLGTTMALLSEPYGGWLVAAGALCVGVLLYVANLAQIGRGVTDRGITTEVAALLMYAVGAYLVLGDAAVAVLMGGIVAVLLQFKQPMHSFVSRMGGDDIRVIMQFVLLALVILPVLPNENYGPFGAFNPHEIWFVVVLIVGLSVAGYIVYKFFGQNAGVVVGGALGGLVSSTATTVSYARRVGQQPNTMGQAGVVLVIASTVAIARVIVEIVVAAAPMAWYVAPPLTVMFLWMLALSFAVYRFGGGSAADLPPPKNPAELTTAVLFGVLYAVIKFAVAATHHYLADSALYAVAGLSGLTDMDAITLSTAKLVEQERLSSTLGWQLILTASLANLAFKGGIALVLGHRQFALQSLLIFGGAIVGGVLILLLWPSDMVNQWIDAALAAQA